MHALRQKLDTSAKASKTILHKRASTSSVSRFVNLSMAQNALLWRMPEYLALLEHNV